MGLVICSPELGLSPESNSGGEVYDREVLLRLCQAGVKVYSLLPKGRSHPEHENLIVKQAFFRSIVPPHTFSALVLPYLVTTYLTTRFDILRVHNPYFVGPAAYAFKKLFPQVPLVASYLHLEEGFNGLIDRLLIKNFDHIITISQSTKTEINSWLKYPKSRITVAYPGVAEQFQPGRKKSSKFTILFLGGLKERKNPQFLLKVMTKLNRPEVELVFAGEGPLRSRLSGKNIRVTGYVAEADKVKVYQQADVVVLPSLKEGFGMTLTEAGACALPVIGADHYSIREIIKDGETGFLAKFNDVDDWVKKLLQLIKSPQLRQKMGEAGRKLVRSRFSWEKNIQTHLKVYENLVR